MVPRLLPEDFKDFIRSLNGHNVRYILLGGWAVGIYGNPRATKDIDFWVAVDDANIARLKEALHHFGAPTVEDSVFQEIGNVFRLGVSPIQIDVINKADGIDFEPCYARRNVILVEGMEISVISKEDLIVNKKASGRHRDLADVEFLEEEEPS